MTVRQIIKDYDDVMTFGKYKGKTVEFIFDVNPGYIVWLADNKIIECLEGLYDEACVAEADSMPPESYFFPDLGAK